jgi:hypothetical protein
MGGAVPQKDDFAHPSAQLLPRKAVLVEEMPPRSNEGLR